jgi:hypothetical protein
LIIVSAIERNLCAFARDGFSQRPKGQWTKSSSKYFSDFSISYQRGSLRMVRVSGIKAAKGVLKAGYSSLKPMVAWWRKHNSRRRAAQVPPILVAACSIHAAGEDPRS